MRKLLTIIFLLLFTTQTFAVESNVTPISVLPNEIRLSPDSVYTQLILEKNIQYRTIDNFSDHLEELDLENKFENFLQKLKSIVKRISLITRVVFKIAFEIFQFFVIDAETRGRIY